MDDPTTFLTDLFGDLEASDRILIWTLPDKRSRYFIDPAAAGAAIVPLAAHLDMYVGVGLRPAGLKAHERGGADSVSALAGLWADVDVAGAGHTKPNLPPTIDDALALVAAMPIDPTIVVDSGHGLQVWWLFQEPYRFERDDERSHVAAVARGWESLLHAKAAARGWAVDATSDLARVLRVPGTVNHKVPDALQPVRTLKRNGPRIAGPSDVEPFVTLTPAPLSVSLNGHHGDLILHADAIPPPDKHEAMFENDAKYKRTWLRKREWPDQSASSYSLSISALTAAAGWSRQERADAIIRWRRKHGEDPKIDRPDWYERTLARGESGKPEAELLAGVDVLEAAEEGDREKQLAFLRAELGIPLERVIRRGARHEQIWTFLALDGGMEIDLGQSADVLNLRHARAAIYEACGHALPPWKSERWFAMAALLAQVAEHIEIEGSERCRQMWEWFENYADVRRANNEDEYQALVAGRKPFVREGYAYLHLDKFREWLHGQGERVEMPKLRVWLRQLGFSARQLSVRTRNGMVVTRWYWCAEKPAEIEVSLIGEILDEARP